MFGLPNQLDHLGIYGNRPISGFSFVFVRIPEDAPWLAEYLHEMTVFPNGKHDDQVDSTAQFLEWQKTPAPHDGYIEWLRREHEKLHRKPVPMPPQTNYAKGSMEWFQQQEELRRQRKGN